MGLVFVMIVGAIVGWLAAIVLQIEAPRGILLNIAAGVVGAVLMGLIVGPLLGMTSVFGAEYRVGPLLLSLLGSLVLVAALNLFWRERLR
jgi:uncharacterized membrane protein YeaQ/YmgE (transglycosylase-associated protein family)